MEQRLEEHARRLPAKPVRRMLEIVKEVWRRSDETLGAEEAEGGLGLALDATGGQVVFWLDVVLDRRWETVMG